MYGAAVARRIVEFFTGARRVYATKVFPNLPIGSAKCLSWSRQGWATTKSPLRLVLSEKTVRNHVERTYHKIGATNRVGASLYALQNGLVTPLNESE